MLIANDIGIQFILRNCAFLNNYFGRGFFNLYVGSLLMMVNGGKNDDMMAFLLAICGYVLLGVATILFIFGFINLVTF